MSLELHATPIGGIECFSEQRKVVVYFNKIRSVSKLCKNDS